MPQWDVAFNLRLNSDAPEIVRLVAEAHALSSVIRAIPIPPRAADRLDALNIMRAVRGTTGIEGAELSEEEALDIIASPSNQPVLPPERSREEQEARNAREVMLHVVDALEENASLLLNEELVRHMHELVTMDIDYARNTPGRYRTGAVSAGSYVPPPSSRIPHLMKEFIRWFNDGPPSAWDPIIQALVAHFYVVSIHPFGDGNGRTARAVESFLLYKGRVNARGFYSLASYYYQGREDYVRYLDFTRFESHGDLAPFVLFGLRGLVSELQKIHAEVLQEVRRLAYRDYAQSVLGTDLSLSTTRRARLVILTLNLLQDAIPIREILLGSANGARMYRSLSERTLARDLTYLEERELVFVEDGRVRANLEVLERFTPPHELRFPQSQTVEEGPKRRRGRPRRAR